MPVNKKISFSIWYVFLAIFAVVLVHDFIVAMQKVEELPYSEFRTLVLSGKVAEVTVTHQRVSGKRKEDPKSRSCLPPFGSKIPIWSRNSTRTTSHLAV